LPARPPIRIGESAVPPAVCSEQEREDLSNGSFVGHAAAVGVKQDELAVPDICEERPISSIGEKLASDGDADRDRRAVDVCEVLEEPFIPCDVGPHLSGLHEMDRPEAR
jgi:hypothetical protein